MNAKIDPNGFLHIERAGVMKRQECPFIPCSEGEVAICGDWCPHFGEPVTTDGVTLLRLCDGNMLEIDQLTDERGKA